jgi:membrane fusion protein (multidrug efflux system)
MSATISESDLPVQSPSPAVAKPKSRVWIYFTVGVVAIVLAYAGFRWLAGGKENTDDAQVAADMVPLAARVGGVVLTVSAVDHQAVKKGDVLVEIDPADYAAKLKQAEAEREAAKAQAEAADAQVRIVDASSRGGLGAARAALSGTAASVAGADAQIGAAKAAVARAQADVDKADADLARAESLRKDDAIPQAQVDSLRAAAAAAHAALAQANAQRIAAEEARRAAATRIAEAQGKLEQSAPVEDQLAAAKANAELAHARLASAEAALAIAQLNLSYTKIVAPTDGHVSKLAVHPGQLVSPSQLVTNVLPTTTYVVANFKETQVGGMRPGQKAHVAIDAYPGRSFHAKVDSIAYGTGAQFALLPPDNASGNFVKVVQRVPVKLAWIDLPSDVRLEAGLSADVTVEVQ